MSTPQEHNDSFSLAGARPWWREPWPWLLMAGPAAAIVGCIITIALAMQHYGDQDIVDGGVKRGLVVSKQVPVPVTSETPAASSVVKD